MSSSLTTFPLPIYHITHSSIPLSTLTLPYLDSISTRDWPFLWSRSSQDIYNWPTGQMKLNINRDLVKPMVKYLANPLLTTIPFHHDIDEVFIGLMIDSPDHDGVFVAKSKSFPTIKSVRMTKDTLINTCGYCKGLTLLDSHRMNFVYFVPFSLRRC